MKHGLKTSNYSTKPQALLSSPPHISPRPLNVAGLCVTQGSVEHLNQVVPRKTSHVASLPVRRWSGMMEQSQELGGVFQDSYPISSCIFKL